MSPDRCQHWHQTNKYFLNLFRFFPLSQNRHLPLSGIAVAILDYIEICEFNEIGPESWVTVIRRQHLMFLESHLKYDKNEIGCNQATISKNEPKHMLDNF